MTHSYINSFFRERDIPVSTARAGNVIGGGDFSPDRIIPDAVRAAGEGKEIIVRNPNSTRPYQHVLEPLYAYLLIVKAQYEDHEVAGFYNVGPDERDCITTGELCDMFCESWGRGLSWRAESDNGPHEANFLKLDCSKLKKTFSWKPVWSVKEAVEKTVEWSRVYFDGGDIPSEMDREIEVFLWESGVMKKRQGLR